MCVGHLCGALLGLRWLRDRLDSQPTLPLDLGELRNGGSGRAGRTVSNGSEAV
jgi:hypothetical protein